MSSHSRFLPQHRARDDAILADMAQIITLGPPTPGVVTQNASFSSSSVDLTQAEEVRELLFVQEMSRSIGHATFREQSWALEAITEACVICVLFSSWHHGHYTFYFFFLKVVKSEQYLHVKHGATYKSKQNLKLVSFFMHQLFASSVLG